MGYQWTNIQGPITYHQTTNVIVLTPIAAEDGTVKVQGNLNNTCLGNNGSKFADITLTRTPVVNISAPGGYIGPRCGLKAPVTFTIPSTVSCAVSYSWTFPPGWTGSSSSNSITLTPSGTTADGGDIQVTIHLTTGKSFSKKYKVTYLSTAPSNPTITKNNSYFEMCPGDSWQFTCTPPAGYPTNYGFDWYTQGASLLVNGVSTTSSAPLHTTSNTVTVSTSPTAYGGAYISVRLSSAGCTPSNYSNRGTRVGVYNSNEFSIVGPSNVCPNTAVDFLSSYIAPDVLEYQWSAPSGWSNSGQGTPYFSVSVPYSFSGGAAITLRLRNRCGITNTPNVLPLYNYGCGSYFSVSPNPVSDLLTISAFDSTDLVGAYLVDYNSQNEKTAKKTESKMEIDVSDLPDGLYVLMVKFKEGTEISNIIVSHK